MTDDLAMKVAIRLALGVGIFGTVLLTVETVRAVMANPEIAAVVVGFPAVSIVVGHGALVAFREVAE